MKKILLIFLSIVAGVGEYLSAVPAHGRVFSLQNKSAKVAARSLISGVDLQKVLEDPIYFYDLQKLPRDVQKLLSEKMHIFLNIVQQIQNVRNIALSTDTQVMVMVHRNHTVTVWHRTEAGYVQDQQIQPIQNVLYMNLSADGQTMAINNFNGTATVWHRTEAGYVQDQPIQPIEDVLNMNLSADGQTMAVNHSNGTVTVWHRTKVGFVQNQQVQLIQDVDQMILSSDAQIMVAVHRNHAVTVCHRTETGYIQDQIQPIQNVLNINLSADGQVMVVLHQNYCATVWHRVEVGFVQDQNISNILNPVTNITLSADGQTMATSHFNGTATIWHRTEAGFVQDQQVHPIQGVDHMILSANGSLWIVLYHNSKASIFGYAPLTLSIVVCAFNMLEKINKTLDSEKYWYLFDSLESFSPETKAEIERQFNIIPLTFAQKNKIQRKKKEFEMRIEAAEQERKKQLQLASKNRKVISSGNNLEASSSNNRGSVNIRLTQEQALERRRESQASAAEARIKEAKWNTAGDIQSKDATLKVQVQAGSEGKGKNKI